MATINFCGATGTMFRGQRTPRKAWKFCKEPERPAAAPDVSCRSCPLYLHGRRFTHRQSYHWTRDGGQRTEIVVAGPGATNENRRACGQIIRQELAGD